LDKDSPIIQEWYEIQWANNAFAECFRWLGGKEAWEKFVLKLGMWPLYRVWFVTVKL